MNISKLQKDKAALIELLRDGISVKKSAEAVGVSTAQVFRWSENDEELCHAVDAILIARAIDCILLADDVVRSGRKLTKNEENIVREGSGIYDALPAVYPEEFGHWPMRERREEVITRLREFREWCTNQE
jgi:hypothetical protein